MNEQLSNEPIAISFPELNFQVDALMAWICFKHSIEMPNKRALLSWYHHKLDNQKKQAEIEELILRLKHMGFNGFKEEIKPVSYEVGLRSQKI